MTAPRTAIDTNIVVRILVRDDERLYRIATGLVSKATEADPLIVNALVIAETLWVLERRLRIDRRLARETLSNFLHAIGISVLETNPLRDWQAVLLNGHRDFSDTLIAAINLEAGCDFTYTLDKRAARDVPGMKLLT